MYAVRVILPIYLLLAACAGPVPEADRPTDTLISSASGPTPFPAEDTGSEREPGTLAAPLSRPDAQAVQSAPSGRPVEAVIAEASSDAATNSEPVERVADAQDVVLRPAGDTDASRDTEPTPVSERKGILSWLRASPVTDAVLETTDDDTMDLDGAPSAPLDPPPSQVGDAEAQIRLASLSSDAPPPETQTDLVAPAKRPGLFGRRAVVDSAGMHLRDVSPGAALPFGEVGRVCDARPQNMGKLVEEAARKGPGYSLYDTAPDSAKPRTFFVTGFRDNCARQFTASLAIFGSPEFHEQLRYGLPADEYPYSTTDKAYEKVKTSVCNVARNTPCGARISRLEKTTVFISVYEHFEDNARWADILLHDGALLATAVKTP